MRDFRELEVWKRAHTLVLAVYRMTKGLPREEVFGLTVQLRRSAMAVATRIAEGCGTDSNPEFGTHLQRAKSSASELEYLILLARDLEYLPDAEYRALQDEVVAVKKMLSGLVRRL